MLKCDPQRHKALARKSVRKKKERWKWKWNWNWRRQPKLRGEYQYRRYTHINRRRQKKKEATRCVNVALKNLAKPPSQARPTALLGRLLKSGNGPLCVSLLFVFFVVVFIVVVFVFFCDLLASANPGYQTVRSTWQDDDRRTICPLTLPFHSHRVRDACYRRIEDINSNQ